MTTDLKKAKVALKALALSEVDKGAWNRARKMNIANRTETVVFRIDFLTNHM